ncbi:MAG: hypothetical protein HUU41_22355 [Bryobacteraceae bacterium]|nr:hypothetical protein [Bryobacteraceae bacterium]
MQHQLKAVACTTDPPSSPTAHTERTRWPAPVPCFTMAGEAERAGMVELLARHVPRSAWAENHRFEVLLRVAKDGGRYLCILNPNVDEAAEDTVRVSAPVNEAVDVWAAGGCAVPVRPAPGGTAIQLRLGPGEATVVYIGM